MRICINKDIKIIIICQLLLCTAVYFLKLTGKEASATFVAYSLKNRYRDYFEYKRKNSSKPIGQIIYDYSKSNPQKFMAIDEIVKEENFLGLDDGYIDSYIAVTKKNNSYSNYHYYWLASGISRETANIMKEYKLLIFLNNLIVLSIYFVGGFFTYLGSSIGLRIRKKIFKL